MFKVNLLFTPHVLRKHKHETDVNTGATCTEPSVSSQIEPNEPGIDQSDNQGQVTEDIDIRSLYSRKRCLFYMQLQAKYLVPSSTIHMIVEEISGLNSSCHQHMRDKIKETLTVNTNLSDIEIDSVFQSLQESDLHAECSTHPSTEYTRGQYFQRYVAYVHPENVYLGTNEYRRDLCTIHTPV